VTREEIERLRAAWAPARDDSLSAFLTEAQLETLDLFDRMQLHAVIGVCQHSVSAADAGRKLFAATRQKRSTVNDSDRLRKYLARFGLDWAQVSGPPR
jgi:transcriptional regulatory protein RtcR